MNQAPEVEFLWRPHCRFCRNLRVELVAAGITLNERNIWKDEEAAAAVRRAARGNETVPTVVVGRRTLVNPSREKVIKAVHREFPGRFPHLPDDVGRGSWWRRLFAGS